MRHAVDDGCGARGGRQQCFCWSNYHRVSARLWEVLFLSTDTPVFTRLDEGPVHLVGSLESTLQEEDQLAGLTVDGDGTELGADSTTQRKRIFVSAGVCSRSGGQ